MSLIFIVNYTRKKRQAIIMMICFHIYSQWQGVSGSTHNIIRATQKVVNSCGELAQGLDGIQYKVNRKLWTTLGNLLLDSRKYSLSINILPQDQRVLAITLLPKQGKNLEKMKNWCPITVTNCDLKIFTKLMSVRV